MFQYVVKSTVLCMIGGHENISFTEIAMKIVNLLSRISVISYMRFLNFIYRNHNENLLISFQQFLLFCTSDSFISLSGFEA